MRTGILAALATGGAVTVGAGGVGGNLSGGPGINGSNSIFSTITAYG